MNVNYLQVRINELNFRLYTNSWVVGMLKDDLIGNLGKPDLTSEKFQYNQRRVNEVTAWAEIELAIFVLLWNNLLVSLRTLSDLDLKKILEKLEIDFAILDEELVRLESILTNLRISLAADKFLTTEAETALGSFSGQIDKTILVLQGINLKFGQKEKNDTTPKK